MKPFTDNIIFYDTEFSSLDPYVGEILSIGIVKPDGAELYLELEYDGEYSQWVREHQLPTLTASKVTRAEAARRIREFVGDAAEPAVRPRAVAYVNQFDTLYMHKLMGGVEQNPFYWMPVDFAAILFAYGYDPELYFLRDAGFFAQLGVDPTRFTQHDALDDARLLRETYFALQTRAA